MVFMIIFMIILVIIYMIILMIIFMIVSVILKYRNYLVLKLIGLGGGIVGPLLKFIIF